MIPLDILFNSGKNINIREILNLELVGASTDSQIDTHGVKVFNNGQNALSVDRQGGSVDCWDISDPTNIQLLSSVLNLSNGHYLYVEGNYCYAGIGSGTQAFVVIDVSNPNSITEVGRVSDSSFSGVQEIKKYGNYCFIGCTTGSIVNVVDVSNPASPSIAGSISGAGAPNYLGACAHLDISADGQRLAVASFTDEHVGVFDISTPQSPTLIDTVLCPLTDPHELVWNDNFIHVCCVVAESNNQGGLVTYEFLDNQLTLRDVNQMDGTDPNNQKFFDYIHGIWLDGNTLWTASQTVNEDELVYPWSSAISRFDVINPAKPKFTGSYRKIPQTHGAQQIVAYDNGTKVIVASFNFPGIAIFEVL